jgi:hypothetical protein
MPRLVTKEKAGKFKLQHHKYQLSATLETEEHQGHTQSISSISSCKEWFTEDNHMYKKCGRHNEDVETVHNDEKKFANQFF